MNEMTNNYSQSNIQVKLKCEECCETIPHSVEAEEYVLHFCGLNCYEKWQDTSEADKHMDEKKINIITDQTNG